MNLIFGSSKPLQVETSPVQLQHERPQYWIQYHLQMYMLHIRKHKPDKKIMIRRVRKDDLPIITPWSCTSTARSLKISLTSPICCWISSIPCSLSSITASLKAISLSNSRTSCLQHKPFTTTCNLISSLNRNLQTRKRYIWNPK